MTQNRNVWNILYALSGRVTESGAVNSRGRV